MPDNPKYTITLDHNTIEDIQCAIHDACHFLRESKLPKEEIKKRVESHQRAFYKFNKIYLNPTN